METNNVKNNTNDVKKKPSSLEIRCKKWSKAGIALIVIFLLLFIGLFAVTSAYIIINWDNITIDWGKEYCTAVLSPSLVALLCFVFGISVKVAGKKMAKWDYKTDLKKYKSVHMGLGLTFLILGLILFIGMSFVFLFYKQIWNNNTLGYAGLGVYFAGFIFSIIGGALTFNGVAASEAIANFDIDKSLGLISNKVEAKPKDKKNVKNEIKAQKVSADQTAETTKPEQEVKQEPVVETAEVTKVEQAIKQAPIIKTAVTAKVEQAIKQAPVAQTIQPVKEVPSSQVDEDVVEEVVLVQPKKRKVAPKKRRKIVKILQVVDDSQAVEEEQQEAQQVVFVQPEEQQETQQVVLVQPKKRKVAPKKRRKIVKVMQVVEQPQEQQDAQQVVLVQPTKRKTTTTRKPRTTKKTAKETQIVLGGKNSGTNSKAFIKGITTNEDGSIAITIANTKE